MFNRTLRLLAVAAVALPLAACAPRDPGDTGGTAGSAGMTTTTTTTATSAPAPAPESAQTGAASPMAGMDMSTPAAGATGMASPMAGMDMTPDADGGMMVHTAGRPFDAVFLDLMVMHHQQAVQMAQDVLPQAKRPEVRELAQNIIDSQQEEIEKMRGWRQAWYPGTPALSDAEMSAMMKMDMQSPAAVSDDPEQRFLAEMIPHHQEAIRMSREAVQDAEHPELRTMAQGIIEEQEKEIARMQTWLEQWTAER